VTEDPYCWQCGKVRTTPACDDHARWPSERGTSHPIPVAPDTPRTADVYPNTTFASEINGKDGLPRPWFDAQ
jgi:hypothetical protein